MNVEKFTLLRNTILESSNHFDMDVWFKGRDIEDLREHKCGTAACIGGWAAALFFPALSPYHVGTQEIAIELDIPYSRARALFYPPLPDRNGEPCPYNATAEQAVRVMDHLAETGEVDWSKAFT